MRALLIAAFAANVALAALSFGVLPERVAIHFGAEGAADGWASNRVNAAVMIGLHTALFLCLYFSPRLMLMFPPRWINIPHREYWLSPGNRPAAARKVQHMMWRFGFAMFTFLLAVQVLTVEANLADVPRLDPKLMLAATVAFLSYTAVWLVSFLLAFRIPKRNEGDAAGRF